jgi:pimeloyl-ACP methyl ester carboxylesterase
MSFCGGPKILLRACNIEAHDAVRSRFDFGRELGTAIDQGILRGLLLLGHSLPQNDVRALGRLGLGYPELYPRKLRALVASDNPRQRLKAIKDRNRPIAPCHALLLGLATERCLDNKTRHEDAGKKHD